MCELLRRSVLCRGFSKSNQTGEMSLSTAQSYPPPKVQVLLSSNSGAKFARYIKYLDGMSPTKRTAFSYQTDGLSPTKRTAFSYQTDGCSRVTHWGLSSSRLRRGLFPTKRTGLPPFLLVYSWLSGSRLRCDGPFPGVSPTKRTARAALLHLLDIG